MVRNAWWSLVRCGFRLLYHEMAFTYDAVSWTVSLGEWQSWQRSAIPYLNVESGARVLELAHGTGALQIDLSAAGLKPIGLDFSPAMGRIARRKLARQRVRCQLIRGRAQALPFADESFPAAVSTFPTDFIVDPATITEVYRVLKPGGRFVFVPSGTLSRGGLAREGIEAAYRATGQGNPWPAHIVDRFTAAGFALTAIQVPCRISVAQVVIAQK